MVGEGKGTVLIVEDAGGFRDIYRTIVEADEYHVIEAGDGKTGLELAMDRKPDIILLDLVLPELDGFQVLEQLRANEPTKSIPVIILSVLGGRDNIQRALDLGANDYSVKGGVSPREVLNKIRSLLGGPDVKEVAGSYHVSVKEGRDDAPRLEWQIGVGKSFECPRCKGRITLELIPETSSATEGHSFKARFVCSVCGRGF